ncbi:10779_t:CDS:2, partial [Acaulospora morrowiae]
LFLKPEMSIKKEETPVVNSPTVTRQKLEETEAELRELLIRKKQLDKSLKAIEKQIWQFEGSYLEETNSGGNLIRGFDGYLRATNDKKKKSEVNYEDRLFSRSSTTSERANSKAEDSSSSSDDYKSSGFKKMGDNMKKKKNKKPINYTYPQEVKEVKRIRLSLRDNVDDDFDI